MKTLIVEDNATFRKAFSGVLHELFPTMDITMVDTGDQALVQTKAFSPDLIFMDIRLGQENGLDLTRKIKQLRPEVSVVILTDYNLPEYREAAFESGADDFVVKGTLNPPAIKALIKAISQGRGLQLNDTHWVH